MDVKPDIKTEPWSEYPTDLYQLPIQSSDIRSINLEPITKSLPSGNADLYELLKQPLDVIAIKEEDVKIESPPFHPFKKLTNRPLIISLSSKYSQGGNREIKNQQRKSYIARIKNKYFHRKVNFPIERFSCELCPKTYTRKYDLNKHYLFHTGDEPYSCHLCGKKFTQVIHYKKHTLTHMESTSDGYVCILCGKIFGQKCHLKRHYRSHTQEKPFMCQICNRKFTRKDGLLKHTRRNCCFPIRDKPYKCPACDRSFVLETSVLPHFKKKHSYPGERYNNEKSNNRQETSSSRHLKVIPRKRTYLCVICNTSFAGMEELNKHYKTHSRSKSYTCDICGSVFTSRVEMKQHAVIHKRAFNYKSRSKANCASTKTRKCFGCNETFGKRAKLIVSCSIHTKDKRPVCNVCHRCVADDSELKTHCLKHVNDCYVKLEPFKFDNYSTNQCQTSLCNVCKTLVDPNEFFMHYSTHVKDCYVKLVDINNHCDTNL